MEGTSAVKILPRVEVTIEQVKASSRREYNPYEWCRKIDRYASYPECRFFYDEKVDEYFAIYVAQGIRFMQTIEYSSMLSSGGLQVGYVFDTAIQFNLYNNGKSIEKTESNRQVMKSETSFSNRIFFWG
jgi:hypothetical protein